MKESGNRARYRNGRFVRVAEKERREILSKAIIERNKLRTKKQDVAANQNCMFLSITFISYVTKSL